MIFSAVRLWRWKRRRESSHLFSSFPHTSVMDPLYQVENARSIVKLRGSHPPFAHTPTYTDRQLSTFTVVSILSKVRCDQWQRWFEMKTAHSYMLHFLQLLHVFVATSASSFINRTHYVVSSMAEARFANAKFRRKLKNKETKCDTKFDEDENMKIKLINRISLNFSTIMVFGVAGIS